MANGSRSLPVILSCLLGTNDLLAGYRLPCMSPSSKHGNRARPSTGINLMFPSRERERVPSTSLLLVDHGKHYHCFPHLNHATLSGLTLRSVLYHLVGIE